MRRVREHDELRAVAVAETSSLANLTPSQIGFISEIANSVTLVSRPINSTSLIDLVSLGSDLNLLSLIHVNLIASPTANAAEDGLNASQGKNIPNFIS